MTHVADARRPLDAAGRAGVLPAMLLAGVLMAAGTTAASADSAGSAAGAAAHASTSRVTSMGDMPGMDHDEHGTTGEADPDRPLGLVLGGFGAASVAVLAAAALMRRRDAAARAARQSRPNARSDAS